MLAQLLLLLAVRLPDVEGFLGESTVQEMASKLEPALGEPVVVGKVLRDRVVYISLLPQTGSSALEGLAFSLGLISEHDTIKHRWVLREDPSISYPAAKTVRNAFSDELAKYADAAQYSRNQLQHMVDDVWSRARQARDNGDIAAFKSLGNTARHWRGASEAWVLRRFLAQLPDLGAASVDDPTVSTLSTVPLDLDPELDVEIHEHLPPPAAGVSEGDPDDNPLVVAFPTACNPYQCTWEMWGVWPDRCIQLELLTLRLADDSIKGPSNSLSQDLLRKLVSDVVRLYDSREVSTDALPPIAAGLGYSMAAPCEPGLPRWEHFQVSTKLSLNTFLARAPTTAGRPQIGFDAKAGWIRLNYPQFRHFEPKVPWSRLLPWLRKARAGQDSISHLCKIYAGLSIDDLRSMNDVHGERPLLGVVDLGLIDHAYLIRCLSDLGKDALDRLKAAGSFTCAVGEMPDHARQDAINYLRSSRNWPVTLPYLHPGFDKRAAHFRFVAESRLVDGKRYLAVELSEYQQDGGNFRIPVAGP